MLFSNRRFAFSIGILITLAVISLIGPMIYQRDPTSYEYPAAQPPSRAFPLGTDGYGRDILAQLIHGIRSSLYVGILTALVAVPIGLLIGALAGIYGGTIDNIFMSITNIILSIPVMLIAILIASLLKVRSIELVAVILGAFSWPWFARAIRAQLMSLREREYVFLSLMSGYGKLRIALEDLLPNIMPYTFIAIAGFVNTGVMGEAGLSMINLGPTKGVTLGIMLQWAAADEAFRRGLWWWFLPPGIVITIISFSLLMLGTAIDEIFNPQLREK